MKGDVKMVGIFLIGCPALVAFVASIVWVWRDANRRGQPGFIVAVLVGFLLWPLSLIVWLAARPGLQDGTVTQTPARGGRGCLWAALIVSVIVLLSIMGFLWVNLGRPVPQSPITKAVTQAKRTKATAMVAGIAKAYLPYRETHGHAPKNLADLQLMWPPSSDQFCELLPGTNATDIIVREAWKNHNGWGGAIAFGDGHVEWVDSRYKPLRMDVVKTGVEKQLRQQLGEEFVKVGSMTFNAQENRYDIEIFLNINGEFRRVLDLSQVGVKEDQNRDPKWLTRSARHAVRSDKRQDLSSYAGSLELVRRQGAYIHSILVDELMEAETGTQAERK
jgi:prepilin-type processing-associated H-X9-DG protein